MSSKLNILVHLNAYKDPTATNNPSMNNFKWNRDAQGIDISEPTSIGHQLPAGETLSLFSGTLSTSADGTTEWDIALKAGSASTYRISHASGTAPAFRTARVTGADATTEVTTTKNAKLLTFTSTAGTALDLIAGGAVIGDEVRIGDDFNASNRGKFKIIGLTATSLSVENEGGAAEVLVLGANFADDLSIHSSSGIQVGDKIDIIAGFSLASFGTYEITDAAPDFIEIFSNQSLPDESGISNSPDAFLIYRDAKSFLYIESDQKLEVTIDGTTVTSIETMNAGTEKHPGVLMLSASIKSATIENKSQNTATIFYVTAE